MKNYILIAAIILLSSCDRITPEEKAKLQSEIAELDQTIQVKQTQAYLYTNQVDDLERTKSNLNTKIEEAETKLGIFNRGERPRYVLGLHFQENKFGIGQDEIEFDFEIPVDEQFYNESMVGKKLGEGSRSWSFGHDADVTVTDKRIE